jgi:hypothetical protein
VALVGFALAEVVDVASDDGSGCWRSSMMTLRETGIRAMVSAPPP